MLKSFGEADIDKLKKDALSSPLLRSRLLLHDSQSDNIQQMLIVLHHSSHVQMHRHPIHKSESYYLIEGLMRVHYWDSQKGKYWFDEYSNETYKQNLYGRHSNGIWHMPESVTEWCVYLETYDGPFIKEVDVEYIDQNLR
ncbi:cupin fold metalloprotein, WbuC family [bacterium]|nr:cupin fold metalloprotein, WbuC family [bacterium]